MGTIGMVGLGKMGANMAQRLRAADQEVVGFDRADDTDRDVDSLEALVAQLSTPRIVWVMVQAGDATYSTVDALGELLAPGDVIVDGSNSRYTDDQRHGRALADRGIGFVDAGLAAEAAHRMGHALWGEPS